MPIPPAIQSIAVARIAEIDAKIDSLTKDRDELRAWLDAESAPLFHPPAPRSTRAPYANIGKEPRPQRLREGTTDTELLFPRGSYSTAAVKHGFGTVEVIGVWLTDTEWQRAKQFNRERKEELSKGRTGQ